MNNDSTGKPARLSLPERAKLGLPLSLDDVAELEHPADDTARKRLAAELHAAFQYGDLPERFIETWIDYGQGGLSQRFDDYYRPQSAPVLHKEPAVDRETYQAWRAQCPQSLLSEPGLSKIFKWLNATPAIPSLPAETSRPELAAPSAKPEKTTREIALFEAETAALLALRKQLKREPNFDEFWDYLVKRDDTGTVADSTNDRLIWIGKDNEDHTTLRSSFRNRLTSAKKRNPFTPS